MIRSIILAGAATLALGTLPAVAQDPTPTTVPVPVPQAEPGPVDAPLTTATRPDDVSTTTPVTTMPGMDGDAPSDSAPGNAQPAPGTVLVERPRTTIEAETDPEVAVSPDRTGDSPAEEPDRKPKAGTRDGAAKGDRDRDSRVSPSLTPEQARQLPEEAAPGAPSGVPLGDPPGKPADEAQREVERLGKGRPDKPGN